MVLARLTCASLARPESIWLVGTAVPFALLLWERQSQMRGDADEILAQKTSVTAIVLDLVGIAILVLFLWPGTAGPNRFGADPRLAES